jgi:hypothetical protein
MVDKLQTLQASLAHLLKKNLVGILYRYDERERGGGEDAKKHRLEPVSLCGQNVNEATVRIFVNKKLPKNCHNAMFGRKVAILADNNGLKFFLN